MALYSLAHSVLLPPLLNALIFLFSFGVVEEHTLPDSMEIGGSVIASWTIEKGQTEGFARLQLNFPEGINIEPIQTDGASFTFEERKAKFIWMDIPSVSAIHVSVKITAQESFIGGEVQQRFSFIEKGSRQDVEFEPHVISLVSSATLLADQSPSENPIAKRIFVPEGSNEGRMTIELSRFQQGSFLKLTEVIPSGCDVEWETNANPSIQDQFGDTLRLVWQTAPSVSTLRLSYRLSGDLNYCVSSIHGTWNTVIDNQPYSFDCPPYEWDNETTASSKESTTRPTATDAPVLPPVKTMQTDIPDPDEWLAFRVQIMACHKHVNQKWFADNHLFEDPVDAEPHEDWIKYTTGSHTNYRQARNARVRISHAHQFPGPFVTAYLRNERITVQEALLLSKQNWIP